jgi:ketosteroid isomerase-like protein
MTSSPSRPIIILALVLFSSFAYADDQGSKKSKLIALENAWNQAQLHQDAKALAGLVSDTYIYTDYDGTLMNKTQFLADIADSSFKTTLSTNEDVRVFLYDNAAIVTGTYHTKGNSKTRHIDHWGRFTDTWLFQLGRWQCVATHTNLIKR